jgi:RNA-binding protein 25
VGSGERRKF